MSDFKLTFKVIYILYTETKTHMKKIVFISTATLLSACNWDLKPIPPNSTAHTLATIAIITLVIVSIARYVYIHFKKN